jgi:hypothetical protein
MHKVSASRGTVMRRFDCSISRLQVATLTLLRMRATSAPLSVDAPPKEEISIKLFRRRRRGASFPQARGYVEVSTLGQVELRCGRATALLESSISLLLRGDEE